MREICALILLALLIIGAVINVNYLDGIIGDLLLYIDAAEEQSVSGMFTEAADNVMLAAKYWESKSLYTHILLRHTEIDSCSDAFYELYSEVNSGDYPSARGAFEKVRAHLLDIVAMERPSFGSIF